MSILDEIKGDPISEVVSKEALDQLDLLIDKLKTALKLQTELNREIAHQRWLEDNK